jgi:hypothetical protein
MKPCEIFHVQHEKSFRWKWRHVQDDGRVISESEEEYELYYECVSAARSRGYEPRGVRQQAAA